MKKIRIHSNPEYETPKKNRCVSIIKNIFKSNNVYLYNINIIFTSDIYVSDLKKEFFSKNQWTDVIAFPINDENDDSIEGEIYISMPTAKENAEKYNQPYAKEIARLVIHGSLHLLGYDDNTKKQKNDMSNLEELFLKQIEWRDLFE
jgi:rRNA maturation RNase YbeY